MNIKDFFELVDYRITEGSDYCWSCFGPNAYLIDSWDGDHNGASLDVIFDTNTQVVYQVEANDYRNERAYRWTNPDFVDAFRTEESTHGEWARAAWEDVDYVDLDNEVDFLQKARAIVLGEDYDTRVTMELDLPESEIYKLMTIAHEKDITFNQLIEEILRDEIDRVRGNDDIEDDDDDFLVSPEALNTGWKKIQSQK